MQNFMKTILSGVQKWTKKEIKDNIKNSTADWNQNDSSADNYVKNRTHWEEKKSTYIIPEMTVTISEDGEYATLSESCPVLTIGQTYTVILNGVTYECVARLYDEDDALIGNGEVYGGDGKGNGEPFAIDSYNDGYIYLNAATAGEYTVSISGVKTVIHKLDSRYLDIPTNIATTDDVQEAVDVANNKMDINNPVGTGSFSMNRKAETIIGQYSHAEGYNATASGDCSHAEGNSTTASGDCSHAEGNSTTAMGLYSHAEGRGTVASRNLQHVQGKYNIIDKENSELSEGKYAHIVGNGHSMANRSNAHTLDWNGVGWFQGGLQVGGNAQDDGAKNVLLEGDAVKLDSITATLPATAWRSIVYGNGKFVAVPYYSNNIAAYSEDGITWEQATLLAKAEWRSIVYGNGKFVAVAYDNNIAVYSEDGITWTQTTLSDTAGWKSVAYGNGKFVAVGGMDGNRNNIAVYSEDGITWTQTTLPDTACWSSVAYGNGKFVAVGGSAVTGNVHSVVAYSEDGITWTQTTSPIDHLTRVIYGNGKFVAAIGRPYSYLFYSEDGITWTQTNLPDSGNWDVSYGNGKFVAINNDYNTTTLDIVAYSEDGITWTQTNLPSTSSWSTVAYGNGKFVAVPRDGNIAAYSKDCINWHNTYEVLVQDNEDVTDKVRDLILPISSAATVGQTIVVKSVDENGKPTEWEAVDPWVIASSTEGSTKKFKISIDDTGTLIVSEIVVEEAE